MTPIFDALVRERGNPFTTCGLIRAYIMNARMLFTLSQIGVL